MSHDFYVVVVSGNCLWGRGLEDGRRLRLRSLQHRKYHGVTAIRTALLTWSAKYRSVSRWFPEGLRATDRSGCRVTATGAVSIDDVHHSCEWLSFYKMYYPSSSEYLGYASSKFFTPLHVSRTCDPLVVLFSVIGSAGRSYLADQKACCGSDKMLLEDEQICQATQRIPTYCVECLQTLQSSLYSFPNISIQVFNCASTHPRPYFPNNSSNHPVAQ